MSRTPSLTIRSTYLRSKRCSIGPADAAATAMHHAGSDPKLKQTLYMIMTPGHALHCAANASKLYCRAHAAKVRAAWLHQGDARCLLSGRLQRTAPLPVPLLYVCKAMPLVWQRHEGLRQNLNMGCGHAELALVSPFDAPSGANNVPGIHQTLQASVRQQQALSCLAL